LAKVTVLKAEWSPQRTSEVAAFLAPLLSAFSTFLSLPRSNVLFVLHDLHSFRYVLQLTPLDLISKPCLPLQSLSLPSLLYSSFSYFQPTSIIISACSSPPPFAPPVASRHHSIDITFCNFHVFSTTLPAPQTSDINLCISPPSTNACLLHSPLHPPESSTCSPTHRLTTIELVSASQIRPSAAVLALPFPRCPLVDPISLRALQRSYHHCSRPSYCPLRSLLCFLHD
jgi:hypothetical protein